MSTATRPRFTAKANPHLGKSTVMTARIPDRILKELDEMVAHGRPGVVTRTDAVQDAIGLWLIMEQDALVRESMDESRRQREVESA